VVLTQKDDENNEAPISFMSTNLQGPELKYPSIDKQAYVVYKAVKHFRSYILKNHTKVIVPHPVVRSHTRRNRREERKYSHNRKWERGEEIGWLLPLCKCSLP
jgi:hypothetical protein